MMIQIQIRFVGKAVEVTFGATAPEDCTLVLFEDKLQFRQKLTRKGEQTELFIAGKTPVVDDVTVQGESLMTVAKPGRYTAQIMTEERWALALQDFEVKAG